MGDRGKFIPLAENEDFYSHLNMEDIINADYVLTKIFLKDFKMKN